MDDNYFCQAAYDIVATPRMRWMIVLKTGERNEHCGNNEEETTLALEMPLLCATSASFVG